MPINIRNVSIESVVYIFEYAIVDINDNEVKHGYSIMKYLNIRICK